MTEQEKLIKSIYEEYNTEKNKTHTNIKSMWTQYQKMGKELSEGIYAEDNHFIYELIQNAEDTECLEQQHSIEFTIMENGLLVVNNEKGFSDEQIQAICAFGQSTKSSNKNSGYIGEKGIGFKSVFKISDKPAISSNGYKFYFRRFSDDGLETEYIIPHWIDDIELKNYPEKFQESDYTALYLPFSNTKKIEQLKNDIKHIEPILLLFLKKLTNIKISENQKTYVDCSKIESSDENLYTITIDATNSRNKYFLFKKTLSVPQDLDEVSKKDGRRKEVKHREIVLAFPELSNELKEDRIFAFLPTKLHSGLKFIIQADFILQSGRENIAIDSEWNEWQFNEIKSFITDEILEALKNHSKIQYSYLNYFKNEYPSNNRLLDGCYRKTMMVLQQKQIILTNNMKWANPQNIIIAEDCKIDSKYLKILFGAHYEQKHEKFELDNYFVEKFNIRKTNKNEIINHICNYFDRVEFDNLDEKVVLYFSIFLSKHVSIDNRTLNYNKQLFEKIQKALPIIPKYKSSKKFYLYDSIYISSEYKPDYIIENMVDEKEFDFSKYNFLSDEYKDENNKSLENFILKIIEEQKEHKNRKTLDFLTKNPQIVHSYLNKDLLNSYKKLVNYLINNLEDNKEKIASIELLMMHNGIFKNAQFGNIYFSNETGDELDVLHPKLLEVIESDQKYKEFIIDVFKIKHADTVNIIMNEYLPWISKINDRNVSNDKKLIEYTKQILKYFKQFDDEQRKSIKENLRFISINQRDKYLKANNVYLPLQWCSESIEKYIDDKSFFDFLDENKYAFISNSGEDFLEFFTFLKHTLKKSDAKNFILQLKNNLDLSESVNALQLIDEYIDNENIEQIKTVKVFDQNNELHELAEIYYRPIDNFDFPFLNPKYTTKDLENIESYFLSPFILRPFINHLKGFDTPEEAQQVYKYFDRNTRGTVLRGDKQEGFVAKEIRDEFKKTKLIIGEKSHKYYPNETTWKEVKSNSSFFALSTIYPSELQNFFVKTIQISQSKNIKQLVEQIKNTNEKNDEYYNLLVDLNDLIASDNEIEKYYESFSTKPCNRNDILKFMLNQEQLFILDHGKKNKNENFYFNDLGVKDISMSLENRIFSIHDSKYSLQHFENLMNVLRIAKLSSLDKTYTPSNKRKNFSITDYRRMLHFVYDLLFSKYPESYKQINDSDKEGLKKINLLDEIIIYQEINTEIMLDNVSIQIESEKYFYDNRKLSIVHENDLFKVIANEFQEEMLDKAIKDFYRSVIDEGDSLEEYYETEGIKEKQNFELSISDNLLEDQSDNSPQSPKYDIPIYIHNSSNHDHTNEAPSQKNAEDERTERKSALEQIKSYEDREINSDDNSNDINPNSLTDDQKFEDAHRKRQSAMYDKILSEDSSGISPRTIAKLQDEIKNKNRSSPNSTGRNQEKLKKYGHEETKNTFKRRDWYLGQCQICGFTFKTKNGNHCERFTWTDFGKGNWTEEQKQLPEHNLIDEGNSLCLCSRCHSIIQHGGQFKASFLTDEVKEKLKSDEFTFRNFIDEIEFDKPLNAPECFKYHVEWNDMYFINIELNHEEANIYFTEEHLSKFFVFLKS